MKKVEGNLYMVLTAFCWSTAGVFIRFNNQSGILIASLTSIIALLINLLFYRKKYIINKTVVIASIAQALCTITFIYANQLTSVGNAVALQYTSMIFVVIYECIAKKKMPTTKAIFGIIIVLIGVSCFFADKIKFNGFIGNAFALISGAFFGLRFFMNKKLDADAYSSSNLCYIINIALILFVKKDICTINLQEVVAMLGSGIIQIALGGIAFTKGIKYISALSANIVCMLEIILAPLWAFLLFHETIGIVSWIGVVIIMMGILWNIFLEYKQEA